MTAATTPVAVGSTTSGESGPARFRTDIQGLRAVAVVLVLLYHAGVPWVPGGYVGVDVFFVISGFLITGLIVREIERTGRLNLSRFYARRVRRLLPATAVTFVGVAVLTVVALPVTRWASIAGDMVASTLYVVNWRLADRSVEYLAQGSADSPLQHFWSLAVEEQFYVVWPLLVVALAWWARHGVSTRRLTVGLVAIAVPSFAWSVQLTATQPGPAYFVTTTRLWELAIGALLAVGAAQAGQIPERVRQVVGWLGLAAILAAALTFTADTAFPGSAALLPTLGAAAVLLAGTGGDGGRVRVLDAPPLQDVGALSYSLYLWHWPVLVVAASVWGRQDGTLALPTALVAVASSAVPAWFTYRAVERPIHQSRALAVKPWRAGVVGLVCIAVGLGSAAAIRVALPDSSSAADAGSAVGAGESLLGAAALGDDPRSSPAGVPVDTVESIVPAPHEAAGDNADVYADGCHQNQESAEVLSCTYGDPNAETRIALVGDSHAAHWQPALRRIADERGWRLDTYTKSACLFGDVAVWLDAQDGPYSSCTEWVENTTALLEEEAPDVVVVSSSGAYSIAEGGERTGRDRAFDDVVAGVQRTWSRLDAAGSEVVAIVDTPWPDIDIPECVAENRDSLTACAAPRAESVERSGAALQKRAAEGVPGVRLVDLTDHVCPQDECAPVIGGVMVMRDGHHLTGTYAESLAHRLEPTVRAAVEPDSP